MMRRACALLLSFSLNASPLFAYNDYADSDWDSGPRSSVQQFQNDWLTRQSWIQSFNQTSYSPPPLQFPKIDFDLNFFHAFSRFEGNNVTPSPAFTRTVNDTFTPDFTSSRRAELHSPSPLDLDVNTLSTPIYRPQPVGENFQFETDTTLYAPPSQASQPSFPNGSIGNPGFERDLQPEKDPPQRLALGTSLQGSLSRVMLETPEETVVGKQGHELNPSPTRGEGNPLATLQPPKTLFETVARGVKLIPCLFASLGSQLKALFTQVWNHLILGHHTKTDLTLPDGTTLTGTITVNRKGEVLKVSPGTLRTVGQWETNKKGQTSLHPTEKAVTLNGETYIQGTFIYDGNNYRLQGPGIKLTNKLGPTLEGGPVKLYVEGDGQGGETSLGYGSLSKVDCFRETTTNFLFHGSDGFWKLDPRQSGTLTLDGHSVPINIGDSGRLSNTVSTPLPNQPTSKMFITALIPRPESSGFQVLAVAQLKDRDTLKTRIPGATPSPLTTTQANNWSQDSSVPIISDKLTLSLNTQSKIHQEGDHYVFTGGHVAFATLTEPNLSGGKSTPKGQKSLYSEAVFSKDSRLTVTGPTLFPNYRATTVIVGSVSFYDKEMVINKGSIYRNDKEGLRLSVTVGPSNVAIPVKSLDLKNGTFIAVLPDLPRNRGQYIETNGREVRGKIDFDSGQAKLVPVSFKAPLYAPDKLLGVHVDDVVIASAWVTVGHNNDIKTQTDRSGVGLEDWKKIDPRPTFNTPIQDSFHTLTFIVQDKSNPTWSRATALTLSSLMGPALLGEGMVDYLKGLPAAVRETTHNAALTTVSLENKDYPEATLNALQTIASGSDAALRTLTVLDFAGQTSRALATELKPLAQSARQLLNKLPPLNGEFFQPVLNERGHVLVEQSRRPVDSTVLSETLKRETVGNGVGLPLKPRAEAPGNLNPASSAGNLKPADANKTISPLEPVRVKPLETAQSVTPPRAGPQERLEIQWDPLNGPGPLDQRTAATFRSLTYTEKIIQNDLILYRRYGGEASEIGKFWTREKPTGVLQASIDSAIKPEWGNSLEKISSIRVPKGTRIFEGVAARQGGLVGGGNQVVLPEVDPSWVVKQ